MTLKNEIITLSAGTSRIEIWTIGARLNGVSWNGIDGLVDGSATELEAVGSKLNHGSVMGPVANRVAGSSISLEGRTLLFTPNEGDDTLLHSGDKSLRDRIWCVEEHDDRSVRLAAEVADMEDDFPGNRRFEALYTVREYGFELELSASTDAPTLVNLALHPYWQLDAGGRNGLQLGVNAECYLPVDGKKIPTGKIEPVAGTIFDLRETAVPSTEIDHNFCLTPATDIAPSATLQSDRLRLDIRTDAPGFQVFTGKSFGIALEPQHWPDAPHHEAFPSIRLDPGQRYAQFTSYKFSPV